MPTTQSPHFTQELDGTLATFQAALDAVVDILHRARTLGTNAHNRTFTCQAAQRPTADTPLVRTFASPIAHCFPTKPETAHARLALADLERAYIEACAALQAKLTDLTLIVGRQGRPGFVRACAVGVQVELDTERSAGWFLPGDHTGSVSEGAPFSAHSLDTGAFDDMLRVVAKADGWHKGPDWQMTGVTPKTITLQARDAETALLKAWALHNPHLFAPHETRRVTIARIEPSVESVVAQCRLRLPHTARKGRPRKPRTFAKTQMAT